MIHEDSRATGVTDCNCIECFDVVYSYAGDVCRMCDEAGCTDYDTCQRDDTGIDPYWDQFKADLGDDQ